jgi:hypothetical protein
MCPEVLVKIALLSIGLLGLFCGDLRAGTIWRSRAATVVGSGQRQDSFIPVFRDGRHTLVGEVSPTGVFRVSLRTFRENRSMARVR